MKKVIAIIFTVCMAFTYGHAQGLVWYSWNKGYELAKQTDKKMLVFVQADWCHWCKRMEAKTYANAEVMEVIEDGFIPIKFNVEQEEELTYEGEKYTANQLIKEISDGKCNGIPGAIFLNAKTKKAKVEMGFLSPDEILPLLKNYAKKI